MIKKQWVAIPTAWIHNGALTLLPWKSRGEGSDNTAALMAMMAIAHVADERIGIARATYDDLCLWTGLSRAKLSHGLQVLYRIEAIEPGKDDARSIYQLANYSFLGGWAKLPGKGMYSPNGAIAAFEDFHLRRPVELDALKLLFLFATYRDRETNLTNIGYEKIERYTGVPRARIKSAISLLVALSLIYVEQIPSTTNQRGVSNAYRIVGIDPYSHMGTRGRLAG